MRVLSFVCLLLPALVAAVNNIPVSEVRARADDRWTSLRWRDRSFRCARHAFNALPSPHLSHPQESLEAVPAVHISTDAYFHDNDGFFHGDRLTHGQTISLIVTLDRAAASRNMTSSRRHLQRRHRVHAQNRRHPNAALPKPLHITDYKLEVTAPAGFVHRVTHADPVIQPTTLLRPEPQGDNTLAWPRVPIPQYQDTRAVQALRIMYTVTNAAALGQQLFTASVWHGNHKIHESTQDVRGTVVARLIDQGDGRLTTSPPIHHLNEPQVTVEATNA